MIGVLHVPVAIPLILGDAGNPGSYPYAASFREIAGCSVDEVVHGRHALVAPRVISAARALVADGARAITGGCGTLVRFQVESPAPPVCPFCSRRWSRRPWSACSQAGDRSACSPRTPRTSGRRS